MPAVPAGMRVLHAEQLEILFPIRPFFFQRLIAETGLDPGRDAFPLHAGLPHIALVFVSSDGAFAEGVVLDRIEQRFFLAGLYPGFNEVAHGKR